MQLVHRVHDVGAHFQKWLHASNPVGHLAQLVQTKHQCFMNEYEQLFTVNAWEFLFDMTADVIPSATVAHAIVLYCDDNCFELVMRLFLSSSRQTIRTFQFFKIFRFSKFQIFKVQ